MVNSCLCCRNSCCDRSLLAVAQNAHVEMGEHWLYLRAMCSTDRFKGNGLEYPVKINAGTGGRWRVLCPWRRDQRRESGFRQRGLIAGQKRMGTYLERMEWRLNFRDS